MPRSGAPARRAQRVVRMASRGKPAQVLDRPIELALLDCEIPRWVARVQRPAA